ncbi:MAG: maleylpyruvate isomerase family mycothiol-dependent enzyme [Ilumatobacter sp.]|nr:maleylpyruvate isomerase family mycothiol-dependent enzyme [Ilumatobacter sp.]
MDESKLCQAQLVPGQRYAVGRRTVAELVRTLSDSDLIRHVPACPRWRVRDLVAHLVGVASDNAHQISADGALDDWTGGHVDRRADAPIDALLAEWDDAANLLEPMLDAGEMQLPAVVLDLVTHEHDIRGAIDRPGNRADPTLLMAARLLGRGWAGKIDGAGLPPLKIVDAADGGGDAGPAFTASSFEMFRCAFGRRSDAQLRDRFVGIADPAPYIELLCIFGPSPLDIIE